MARKLENIVLCYDIMDDVTRVLRPLISEVFNNVEEKDRLDQYLSLLKAGNDFGDLYEVLLDQMGVEVDQVRLTFAVGGEKFKEFHAKALQKRLESLFEPKSDSKPEELAQVGAVSSRLRSSKKK